MLRSLILGFGIYIAIASGIVTWVYFNALSDALSRDRVEGSVRLEEAASRLRGQLDIYRALVNLAANDPKTRQFLANKEPVSSYLSLLHLTYGVWRIDLVDETSMVVASSATNRIGRTYSRGLLQAARNERLGYAIAIENGQRLIQFSRRVPQTDKEKDKAGIVVMSANLFELEFEWPVTPEPVIFFDDDKLSMSANRPNLLLRTMTDQPPWKRFPLMKRQDLAGTALWSFSPGSEKSTEVQTIQARIPQIEMTGLILLDTSDARATALLQMLLAAALFIALALLATIPIQQRRRLRLEARHSATLEQRVEARTAELSLAQDELVKASNLAALGRLSAGISHELNQPLSAILNFAENGKRLIERSNATTATENFAHIADQVRRITRIIGNLRGFARKEHAPTSSIDIAKVLRHVLELSDPDLRASQVDVNVSIPNNPVLVRAGTVRLEQIITNLVSNSIDSMQTVQEKTLTILLDEHDGHMTLSVKDTGTGIEDPERVFEPFYTTKDLGSSKGLGMGLALSFGLVASFGGDLNCANLDQGAEFVMRMPTVGEVA